MAIDTDQVAQTFEVGPGAELSVSNLSGRIVVRGVEGSRIAVRATKHGRESAKEQTRIEMSQSGNSVTVRTRSDEEGWFKINRSICSVDYDIEVPPDCRVRARGISAEVDVSGVRGGARVETVSGDIAISAASGDISITSVSGDIEGRDLDGNLRLNTTSGDTTLSTSRLSDFNCHTVSGDLSIESPLVRGKHYMAKTVSGDLNLLVPAGTGATVQMRSVSGSVSSDIPSDIIRAGRRHWQGRLNGGGANVEMSTVSGDLRIGTSSTLPPDETGPGDGAGMNVAAHREETTAILQQLERGEITVEEAMERLKALK